MKKLFVLILLFTCLTGSAKNLPDSVVMVIAGKSNPLSEFLFIAQKNGEVDLSDSKSLKEYVELFKNFKLKVADAEARGLHRTKTFEKELNEYQGQLYVSYFSDREAEEQAARVIYDRGADILEFSQIVYYLPGNTVSKDTLAVYKEALAMYEKLSKGEDIDVIGKEIAEKHKHVCDGHHHHHHGEACDHDHGDHSGDCNHEELIGYQYRRGFMPLQDRKAFEQAVYAMQEGTLSKPFRTSRGYHIVKLHKRIPNPGTVRVAHILILKDSVESGNDEALKLAKMICEKAKNGEDFAELAKQYSADKSCAENGGILPEFAMEEMVHPFEKASYALKSPGEISDVVESTFGYHIIKLIEKKERPSFEKQKNSLIQTMKRDEHNFELYKGFDERLKREQGYVFYPEAYAELVALCDDYFPTDSAFFEKAKNMQKPLLHLNGKDHLQDEFAYYIQRFPFSTKTYACDFMQEVYDLFVRDLITINERSNFDKKYPEYTYLIQEYRDGILLFEVSNWEVWRKPVEEQKELEEKWIKSLNEKYPVEINWKLLEKVRKNKLKL